MKKSTPIFSQLLVPAIAVIVSVSALPACSHKSNDEDDTFKQSIIDDPQRADRKMEEKIKEDSIRLGDTARVDKDVHQ